ncbi:deoxycytidine monophosphate deaminase [Sporobolomyces salmoneus]|uniref:deoxycytidine monophosphate deaminase n=1 Tax=Sporobolomyces salmoneus TaxID=183962 RepID=UPI0031791DF3
MLICLIGPAKSGKNSLAEHLTTEHGFARVHLSSRPALGSDSSSIHFDSSSDFLDHVTRSWRRNYVTTDLTHRGKLEEFSKRPFVAVVAVDAPLGVRYRRAIALARKTEETPPTLEEFVEADDILYHGALVASSTFDLPDLSRLSIEAPSAREKNPSRLFPSSETIPSPTPSPARLTPSHSPELSRNSSRRTTPLSDPLTALLPLALTTYQNPFSTLAPFFSLLSLPALSEHLRPTWDTYFMALASLASLRSNCMKRRVGAVLVRDKRVLSTGYNGTPRGVTNCNEGGCCRCNSNEDGWGEGGEPDKEQEELIIEEVNSAEGKKLNRVGQGLDVCVCLHAEENALLEAGRERVSGGRAEAAVLYCNTCPCLTCTVKIVQCGVKEVVYSLSYSMDDASRQVMESAGVILRQMQGVPVPV